MKKLAFAITAVFFAALLLAACSGKNEDKPGKTETAKPTARIADGTGYENVVVFENGVVKSGDFHWRFFLSKVGAGMNAQVSVKRADDGAEIKISFADGAFSVDDGDSVTAYRHLVTFSRDLPEDSDFSSVELGILTNDPALTPEKFFGGSVPEHASVGLVGADGTLVFASYKAK